MNFLSVMKGKQWRIALALAGMLGMSMMCCRAIAQETATEEAATEEATAAPAETPEAPTLEVVNAKADTAALAGHNGLDAHQYGPRAVHDRAGARDVLRRPCA